MQKMFYREKQEKSIENTLLLRPQKHPLFFLLTFHNEKFQMYTKAEKIV